MTDNIFWAFFRSDDTYIDGLVQDCSIPSANALEIVQFYTKHRYALIDLVIIGSGYGLLPLSC